MSKKSDKVSRRSSITIVLSLLIWWESGLRPDTPGTILGFLNWWCKPPLTGLSRTCKVGPLQRLACSRRSAHCLETRWDMWNGCTRVGIRIWLEWFPHRNCTGRFWILVKLHWPTAALELDPASQLKDTERTPRADLQDRVACVGTGNPFLMTGHAVKKTDHDRTLQKWQPLLEEIDLEGFRYQHPGERRSGESEPLAHPGTDHGFRDS